MQTISAFIKLCSKDIQRHYLISAGSVEVLRQIFYYQNGAYLKCIASKNTLSFQSKLSRRTIFYAIKKLHQAGIIHKHRRELRVSTSFLRYYEELKRKHRRLVSWSEYSKINLKWLWKKNKQSLENLYRRVFGYLDDCTNLDRKLHPNSRLKSYDFNINSNSQSLREMIRQTIAEMSVNEIKELYLEKIKEKQR